MDHVLFTYGVLVLRNAKIKPIGIAAADTNPMATAYRSDASGGSDVQPDQADDLRDPVAAYPGGSCLKPQVVDAAAAGGKLDASSIAPTCRSGWSSSR